MPILINPQSIYLNAFTFTLKTDNAGTSNSDQFTLPLVSGGTYDFYIDWGDGAGADHITTYNQVEVTHTYPTNGTYTVRIVGTITGWRFNDAGDDTKLINIRQWGNLDFGGTFNGGFFGCSNMTSITATDLPNFLSNSGVNALTSLFYNCNALTFIAGVEQWAALSTNERANMFLNCNNLNQDISNLITANVTNITNMIRNTAMDQDLSSGDFSGVTSATSFASGTSMSSDNLDALLISLEGQTLQSSVSIDLGEATYSNGDASTAVYNLVNDDSWTLTTGGPTIPNLVLWIDADDSSTITEASSVISAWNDKSLEDYNISTGSATYDVTDPTKPVAQFNVTSDYFEMDTPTEIKNWTSARTIIMVVKVPATPVGFLWDIGVSGSAYRDECLYFNGSNEIVFRGDHSTAPNRTITGGQPSSGFHIFTVQIDSSANNRAVELFQDNISLGSFASMGTSNLDPNKVTIGADPDGGGYLVRGAYTNAGIAESMIYDRLITTDELSTIHTELNTKWGVS